MKIKTKEKQFTNAVPFFIEFGYAKFIRLAWEAKDEKGYFSLSLSLYLSLSLSLFLSIPLTLPYSLSLSLFSPSHLSEWFLHSRKLQANHSSVSYAEWWNWNFFERCWRRRQKVSKTKASVFQSQELLFLWGRNFVQAKIFQK